MLIVFLSKYIQSLVRKAIVLLFFTFSQNSLASYFYDYDLSIRLNLEQLEHCGHEFNSLLSYPINYSNIYKSLKSKNKETNDALCDEIEYWFRTELEALENKNIYSIGMQSRGGQFLFRNAENEIYEDNQGSIYVSADLKGIYKISFSEFR